MKSYRLKDLKHRTDAELEWFIKNSYPQMKNRREEAKRLLEIRKQNENTRRITPRDS